MITLERGGFRIEAAAVAERGGLCCVTAEVFEGGRMVRGYFRTFAAPSDGLADVERAIAEDVARMSCEAE
ncbi:MAG: hypothetical protein MZV65_18695 [Chromatiales bacterium]|nr:hypothetical protein [Chromatiales bacterium]